MIAGVPYDAEVEYLESTGTQWIDTGINASTSVVLNCDFRFTNATGNQLNGTYWNFGRLQFGIVNGSWSVGIGTVGVSGSTTDVLRHSISINVPQKQVLFDGINYGDYSSASAIYASYQSIWLFARTNTLDASSTTPCKEQIFSCAITSDNTLVRDFIPVRVGTVGYLYDRVSRRLFGNQGTGSFIIGPDVARPVMGLRRFKPTARNYVQDGLVAMWDGIENAGWGVHNANATVWKDLVGSRDLTIGQTGSFTPNAFYSNGVSSAVLPSGISLVCTEVALNIVSTSTAARGVLAISSDGYRHGIQTLLTGNGICGGYSSWGHRYSPGVPFTIVTEKKSAFEQNGVAFNGIMNTGWDYGRGSLATLSSYGVSYSTSPFVGYIYAIRAYSRTLTADEIAANYAIDKVRFNLP